MSTTKTIDLNKLARVTDEIFSLDELRSKLALNRPLRIKYGVDVTAPFLHIGHAVNLWVMREFQEAGHTVVFLIGDFTTLIGDPTGKSQTRKEIAPKEIEKNAEQFLAQAGHVLITDPAVLEFRRNSEWYSKMNLGDFLSLSALVTHSRLIQRDMFQTRINNGQEIYMHELLYPVLQGYDSVMLQSDLTIVGSDQLFNELMGRLYQEKFGQMPQVVMTTRITPGTDGKEKQSKSLGNYIALIDSPREKFGKIMSLPDNLIVPYLEVYTLVPAEQIQEIKKAMETARLNPMDAKKMLASALVERYHGREVACAEETWFTETFSARKVPVDIPSVLVPSAVIGAMDLLRLCLPHHSNSAIRRLIQQGAARLNDEAIRTEKDCLPVKEGDVVRVGKRGWFKITVAQQQEPALR